ncbi:MAG: sigma-54-dependent Fis family transcriptional regulator [Candidatus Eisenbacteria bacterium]|uniref:Sigma-54-dependent Fis family transcriptional regulator n=1 Tax=Eiseniibacteriota bacterium TaxID=2212470 RepID=A0A849SJ37_UNCEI|nr:sigma-54-dependent Fis family transcriptional regulator [Candidatus Eisenbacteria bacterium]
MTAKKILQILVVDDDPAIRPRLRGVLEDEGHEVREAADGRSALEALEAARFDVVLLDVKMPGMTGLDALPLMREMAPGTAVIMVSGESTISIAVQAVKRGAFDFIEKPLDTPDKIALLLGVIAQAAQLTELRRHPVRSPAAPNDLGLIGSSPAIAALMADIRRLAPSNGKVFITGENGVGKDLVANAIHRLSKRADQPFVKLNCAALPRDLVESELFGHEKGAFTGAVARKTGRLERADGGTLFLDEIGDLSLEAQAKLLRAIESGEVDRIGSTDTVKVDVRVIAATNKDLHAAIEVGDFRQDLYFRLNALPLHVPPLRERRSDIGPLAQHFLAASCEAEAKPPKRLSTEAIAVLEDYRWPGNVRELRNLMERAAILVDGIEVRAEDLSAWLIGDDEVPSESTGLRGEIERREVEAIRRALESSNWNVTQAAGTLGIDRTNLHRKMRKFGLSRR